MTSAISFLNRSFALFLSTVLAVQPAFMEMASAQPVIIDPNGNVGTRLQAGRPAPVVDIAKPNAGGVSHNRYQQFNVPTNGGVVLNNSSKGGKTSVAGQVAGNSNLTGGSATTIVNEVTSTKSSGLKGRIEVAGDRADVIVANPNGISCDGCSFLNTKNATLTTGVPVISGGNVQFDVTKGTVTIGRKGLAGAATGVGSVNLIGRTVVIDGKITAVDEINVQGGTQRYDLTTGKKAGNARSSGSAGSDYAIDATAFGAMEAGRIQIVGNEQGLGVRLRGAVQATGSDAIISSPGKIEVSSVSARRNVTISSAASSVAVDRDLSAAAGQVTVSAGSTLNLGERSGIYSKAGIALSTASGELSALGDLQSGAGITLKGPKLRFGAYARAGGTVSFAVRNDAIVTGATVVAQKIDGAALGKTLSLSKSAFFSSSDIQLGTGNLSFGRDVVAQGLKDGDTARLVAKVSGDFRNSADLRNLSAAQITWGGTLYNEVGGVLADKALVLNRSKAIHNSGIIYGEDSLKINAAGFFNNATGSVLSKSVQITSSAGLNNLGAIISGGDLRLNAATVLTNDGFVQATRAWLNGRTIENRGKGDFRIANALSMTAKDDLINRGSLNAVGTATFQAGNILNNGMILAEGGITATANDLTNAGSLTSKVLVRLRGDMIANTGVIASYDRVDLVAARSTSNSGSLVADKVLSVSGPVFTNTGDKALVRTKTGQIASATITNSGKIFLVDDFTRKGDLDLFRNDGIFASAGAINLTGRDAKSRIQLGLGSNLIAGLRPDDKTQTLVAGKDVSINAATIGIAGQQIGNTFSRAGIRAGGNIALTTPGLLTIGGGVETKAGNVVLTGADIIVARAGAVYAGGSATLNSAGGLAQEGSLVVKNQLDLSKSFGRLANSGVMSIGRTGETFTLSGTFTNTGYMGSNTDMAIRAAKILNNGHLQSGRAMTLQSTDEMRLKGATIAAGNMLLKAGSLILDKGLIAPDPKTGKPTPNVGFISATQLQITAASFNSRGSISLTGTKDNKWQITGAFQQEGLTQSAGALAITASGITTSAGSYIGSLRSLTLQGNNGPKNTDSIDLTGSLAGQHITLRSDGITHLRATSAMFASGNILLETAKNATLAGQASARNRLDVTANTLAIQGQSYAGIINANATRWAEHSGTSYAKQSVRLTAGGKLVNSGVINSAGAAILTGGFLVRNSAGGAVKATDVTLNVNIDSANTKGSLENFGTVFGGRKLLVRADTVTNAGDAVIRAGTAELRTNGDLNNAGVIHAFGVFANIGRALTNKGTIRGDEIITVVTKEGGIRNAADGRVFAKIIGLASGTYLANDGQIGAAGSRSVPNAVSTRISAAGWLTNNKNIHGKDVAVVGRGVTNNATAHIMAESVLSIQSDTSAIFNHGKLQGVNTTILAKTNFENHSHIVGTATLGVASQAGRIYNKGNLQANEIRLLADKGIILSDTAIRAGNTLLAKAKSAEFKAEIRAGNKIGVETTAGDLTLSQIASAKTVAINSAGTLKAKAAAIRGTTTTQIMAADIKRTDIAATNRKLGVVPGSVGNLYIKLKSGSFGAAPADPLKNGPETALSQYEQTNLHANGSVEIVTSDNLFLTGTIEAKKNVLLHAKGFAAFRNTSLTAGTNLHLQGNKYLKNYGKTSLSAKTVTLKQNWGWFYTSDWLPERVNYDLAVGASNIIINSDHRFVNKKVTFLAKENIVQRDSVISARGIEYVAGKNIAIEFDPFDWRAKRFSGFVPSYGTNPTPDAYISLNAIAGHALFGLPFGSEEMNANANPTLGWEGANAKNKTAISKVDTSNWWDTVSAGLRGHSLLAQNGGIKLTSGQDITLRSGKVHSEAGIDISAGGRFLSEPVYIENDQKERPVAVGWAFDNRYGGPDAGHDRSRVQMKELRAYENQIAAKGNISISAVKNVDLVGTRINSAKGNISLQSALGGINMLAAPGFWAYDYEKKKKRGNFVYKKTTYINVSRYFDIYKKTALSATNGNIDIISTGALIRDGIKTYTGTDPKNAIVSAGTELSAKNVTVKTRHASQSILLGTYAEESVDETRTWTKRKLFSIIPAGKSDSKRSSRVTMQIGNDFLADEILDLKSAANLTIVGGSLKGRTVKVAAAGNLNILAAINSVHESSTSRVDNMVTITTINSGKIVETAALPKITSVKPASFDVGGKVTIAGYTGPVLNTLIINSISSRKFDDRMLHLYTPKDAAAAGKQDKEVSKTYDYVLPKGGDYAYLQTLLKDKGATYETISLRNQTWYDKQVQLNPAFQALLTVAISAATGGIGGGLTPWQKAALDSALNSVASGAITGNFDAEKALKSALTAGASSYVSNILTQRFNLGTKTLGLSDKNPIISGLPAKFSPGQIVDRLGDKVVASVVDAAFYGNDLRTALERATVFSLADEFAGAAISKTANKFGHGEFSLEKLAMKAAVNCIAAEAKSGQCGAGALGGIVVEASLAGGITGTSVNEYRQKVQLLAATAGYLISGGKADAVNAAISAATTDFDNNAAPIILYYVILGALGYTTYEGGGNPAKGLRRIGRGEDVASILLDNTSSEAMALLFDAYPETMGKVVNAAAAAGELANVAFVWVDEKTGKTVSKTWNQLDPETRDLIRGGAKVVSIIVPAGSAGKIGKAFRATNRLPVPDDLPTNIHMGGQGKHIPGHNNFDPSRSTLTADPQDLLAGVHSGQYPIIRSIPRGNSTSNIVDFGKPIGDFKADGVLVGPTQYGQIVRGKNGAHIIPANPNQY